MARKGEQNAWHFAHDGTACAIGAETAVHLMAKQILATERSVKLPPVEVTLSAVDAFGRTQSVTATLARASQPQYVHVELEVQRGRRRPDAVGNLGPGVEHQVEVFVRHAVDERKAQYLEAQECMCYEIRLDDISMHATIDQLRVAVTASPERIRWVSYPGMTALRKRLSENLARILQAFERKKQSDDAQIARAVASQARARPLERMALARKHRERARGEGRLAQANQTFRDADQSTKREYLRSKLRFPDSSLPPTVNQRIPGDDSFGVPRDIWQSDIFRKWIFAEGRRAISLESVIVWLATRYDVVHVFPNSAKVAVWQFFKFLESAGFVRHRGRQHFDVLRDVAPWLESSVAVTGSWFWAPGARACTLQDLQLANDRTGYGLSNGVLLEIYQRARAEHESNGQPDDVARTIAQKRSVSTATVLALLAEARIATCPELSLGHKTPKGATAVRQRL